MTPRGASGSETLWVQPDQILIRQGDVGRELFVLLSGEMAVLIDDRPVARISGQGEVFGELGALTGRPRTATVKARAVSRVLLVRQVSGDSLERLPKILEKIDAAVTRRYQIIHNKTLMYKSLTSMIRRSILQAALREQAPHQKGPSGLDHEGQQRLKIRRLIDERLALHTDADDPKLLDRLAADHGVQDVYREKLAQKPWLDDSLIERIGANANAWKLIEDVSGRGVTAKAECVVEISAILAAYERMPGIRQEMDLIRMEGLIPLKARIETLRTTYCARHLAAMESEPSRLFHDRKIKLAIEGAKADAGGDTVLLIASARELGIEAEYEAQVRNLVAMSETGTHFIDISGTPVKTTDIASLDSAGSAPA